MNHSIFFRVFLFSGLSILLFFNAMWEGLPKRVHQGAGWDGIRYVEMTQNLDSMIVNKKISQYRIQRVLPCLIVRYSMMATKTELTTKKIIKSFRLLNISLILLSAIIFFLMAHFLKLKPPEEIIAFSMLFFNYANLKFSMYYPTLTDTTAFFFGMLISYYFLTNKKILLTIAIFLGSFVYPSILILSLPLLLFKPEAITLIDGKKTISFKIFSFLKILFLLGFTFFLYQNLGMVENETFPWLSKFTNEINNDTLFFSVPLCIAYLFLFFRGLIDSKLNLQKFQKKISLLGSLLIILVFSGVQMLIYHFANDNPGSKGFEVFFRNVSMYSVSNPLTFLVSHSVYYGPFVLLIIFFFKEFNSQVRKYGIGLLLFLSTYGILGLMSESRMLINAYPLFIIPLTLAIGKHNFKLGTSIFIMLITLFGSKFWYKINTPDIFTKVSPDIWLIFPQQRYAMNQGPWMSNEMYLINLVIILAVGTILYFGIVKKIKQHAINENNTNEKTLKKTSKKKIS